MEDKKMRLKESKLPQMYSKALYEEKLYNISPAHADKLYDVLFTGVANLLNHTKTQDHPVAYIINAVNGNFLAGAVCQFFPNEDQSNPGNWSLIWTFDEKDIPENALKMGLNDIQTHSYFREVAGAKYNMQFKTTDCCVNCIAYTLIQLKKWLDENAKEDMVEEIEMDGVFVARVGVEDGVKVFTIEPAGEVKNLIKDDAAIEK